MNRKHRKKDCLPLSIPGAKGFELHIRGLAEQQHGNIPGAIEFFTRATQAPDPRPENFNNLATALGKANRMDEALAALDRALAMRPDYPEAHNNRGIALDRLGRAEEARQAFARALELKPDYAQAWGNYGNLLAHCGLFAESAAALRKACALQPDCAPWLGNLARSLRRLAPDGPDEAAQIMRRIASLHPESAEHHNNHGCALQECGRYEESIESFHKAIELQPDYGAAHFNQSLALLALGRFNEGWLKYEWRRTLSTDKPHAPRHPAPQWSGAPAPGAAILLTAEQGLGDTIQFARYAQLVKQRCARVVVECQPRLAKLLARTPGIDQIITKDQPVPHVDAQARLLSLPAMFGTTVGTVPANGPYVFADPERVAFWKPKLGEISGFKIGVAWQGSKSYPGDHFRSIALREFAPVAKIPGVRLINLQQGEGLAQVESAGFELTRLTPTPDEEAGPFADTAAIMSQLDLVVTSDTSLAHLAGALGAAVWVALPRAADWRWMTGRADSPWYPVMRLWRQQRCGDWGSVFEQMAAEVRRRNGAAEPVGDVRVPVSAGELIDKITILEIKRRRITDTARLENVERELEGLMAARRESVQASAELARLTNELVQVNEALWEVEDAIRAHEARADFGEAFVSLARAVYHANDRRSELKRAINRIAGAAIVEEKCYAAYGRDARTAA